MEHDEVFLRLFREHGRVLPDQARTLARFYGLSGQDWLGFVERHGVRQTSRHWILPRGK